MSFGPSDKMDPVLEIWVDDDTSPVSLRLRGLLNSTTRVPFLSLMGELLENGARRFLIDIRDVHVGEPGGRELLALRQRQVCDAGGTLDVIAAPPRLLRVSTG
jgi:hypothetical protein